MTPKPKPQPPPAWVQRLLPLLLVLGALAAWWGPSWAPRSAPSKPCPAVDASAYAGAPVRGEARVAADGAVDLQLGPIVQACNGRGARRVCKSPSELVVAVHTPGAATTYVQVPAGSDYRFVVAQGGSVCQLLSR